MADRYCINVSNPVLRSRFWYGVRVCEYASIYWFDKHWWLAYEQYVPRLDFRHIYTGNRTNPMLMTSSPFVFTLPNTGDTIQKVEWMTLLDKSYIVRRNLWFFSLGCRGSFSRTFVESQYDIYAWKKHLIFVKTRYGHKVKRNNNEIIHSLFAIVPLIDGQ